jgi:hypothetical protein
MRAWQHSIALAALATFATSCRRDAPPPPAAAKPRSAVEVLLDDVVDPWTWPQSGTVDSVGRAVEDIGPYERLRPGDPTSPLVNTNAHYWTALAGIAWDRDVDIDFDDEPVDVDGDGRPDTTLTRHIHAKGGILANPRLFGLTPTPDDPRGHRGVISASTGVLGLREALDPAGRPTGEIGMTCWVCHGEANPVDGKIVLGLPGVEFDYGLLLATAAVLDDANAAAVEYRRARGFPAGRTVRARLLLAGPGRQDLTGEFGLDVTVPGTRSARYAGTARVRQGTRGLVNPISVPGVLAASGLELQNWSGSEDARGAWANRLRTLYGDRGKRAARPGILPIRKASPEAMEQMEEMNDALAHLLPRDRALLFDLRNLGTLGLQQDSFPALLWADAAYGRLELPAETLDRIGHMYAIADVRGAVFHAAASVARPSVDPARLARGREIFTDRIVGQIANRQILRRAPSGYASAKLEGPILAPIDPTQPLEARLTVRCADCHSAAPLDNRKTFAENPPPLGRCSHCHTSHVRIDDWKAVAIPPKPASINPELVAVGAIVGGRSAEAEVKLCTDCHSSHLDFGPLVYSSSRLFPFDADGDGDAQLRPSADRAAGGIGTDPWLAFDVPRPQWPFSVEVPVLTDATRAGHVQHTQMGVGWVRAAPLVNLAASAPYLHNGSVPTLRALFDPAARRPKTFALGKAGFVFDTRLPGNGNQGHEFGTTLTQSEKDDLVAFLETL